MVREAYVSPRMDFEEVKVNEAVANTCWGFQGKNRTLYCDIPGEGYTSFQIAKGNCDLNLINVNYYTKACDDPKCNEIHTTAATAAQQEALRQVLVKAGGNDGQPFAGEGEVVIPDKPGPNFS